MSDESVDDMNKDMNKNTDKELVKALHNSSPFSWPGSDLNTPTRLTQMPLAATGSTNSCAAEEEQGFAAGPLQTEQVLLFFSLGL